MSFKKIRSTDYSDLKMTVSVYEHEQTGALHYHTKYDTIQNSFNVVINTLPQGDNGVAHILEHSVLNGSDKYPMNGVFFSMQGRNFETFSNASTGFELTQYPFSTVDEQGYFNLMSAYLDAVFFPKLKLETFLQEGWRYSFEKDAQGNDKLQYAGVVYNEMKGSYVNPSRVSYVEMMKLVFKNTQYENFAGGHPLAITDLKYDEFKKFHQKFYHPTNATFYTFGNIDVDKIHQQMQELCLNKFTQKQQSYGVELSKFELNGNKYESSHPASKGMIYFKGYQLPKFDNLLDLYTAILIFDLLQSGTNDFREVFEQAGLNITAEGMGLLPVDKEIAYLSFKMDDDHSDKIENILEHYFKTIAEKGIAQEEVDNFFDHFELTIRQGEAATGNIGMHMINQYLTVNRYHFDKIEDINDSSLIKSIRHKVHDKNSFKKIIEQYFLNNEKTFVFISKADPYYTDEMNHEIAKKLQQKENELNDHDIEEILQLEKMVEDYRVAPKDLSILPRLNIKNIKIKKSVKPKYTQQTIQNSKVISFDGNTHQVSYIKNCYPVQANNQRDIFLSKLLCDIIGCLSLEGKTLEKTNFWKEEKMAGIGVKLHTIENERTSEIQSYITLETKGLSEHTEIMSDKLDIYSKQLSFEHIDVIVNHINSSWRHYLNSYQENAHAFAIYQSQSAVSELLSFQKMMSLDYRGLFLKEIIDNIENNDFSFVAELKNCYERIFLQSPVVFFAGDEKSFETFIQSISQRKHQDVNNFSSSKISSKSTYKKIALDLNIPINHVAFTFPVPKGDSSECGALFVLAKYIQPYLHTNVREKGGAYGAQSSYESSGIFTFYSYRDPNPTKTIEVFNSVYDYILNHDIDEAQLEISKLNIVKNFNKPKEDIHRAMKMFNDILEESNLDDDVLCEQILKVTAQDLKNITKQYLSPNQSYISVSTNEETIKKHFKDWEQLKITL